MAIVGFEFPPAGPLIVAIGTFIGVVSDLGGSSLGVIKKKEIKKKLEEMVESIGKDEADHNEFLKCLDDADLEEIDFEVSLRNEVRSYSGCGPDELRRLAGKILPSLDALRVDEPVALQEPDNPERSPVVEYLRECRDYLLGPGTRTASLSGLLTKEVWHIGSMLGGYALILEALKVMNVIMEEGLGQKLLNLAEQISALPDPDLIVGELPESNPDLPTEDFEEACTQFFRDLQESEAMLDQDLEQARKEAVHAIDQALARLGPEQP